MTTKSSQLLFLSVSIYLAAFSYENAKPVFFAVVNCACIIEGLVQGSAKSQGRWLISNLKTHRTSRALSQGFGKVALLTVFLGRTATNGSMICFYNVLSGKTNYQLAF